MKLVTAAEMRALEQRAVEAGTPLGALMDAAGLAVAQEVWLALGVVAERRIVVMCGSGNNGGDGLVAARHLAEWEADVAVWLLSPRTDSDANLVKAREHGARMLDPADIGALRDALGRAEVVIDGLLGTGRSRPAEGALAEALQALRDAQARSLPPTVIAIDLPSGIDADNGAADPLAVRADVTVACGFAKVGLYTLPGSEHAGRVEAADIGLPSDAAASVRTELLDTPWVRARLPERSAAGNKGTFGRVLVFAGSAEYAGAARLAAEACYRAGAGLVTLACSAQVQAAVAPALPEATYLLLDDVHPGAATIVDTLDTVDVLLIGPGLGAAPAVRDAARAVLRGVPDKVRGCVIDADALNALAETPDWARSLPAVPCVLTPHPGEMARLTSTTVADVQGDRLGVARETAAACGHVLVLKGAHTVVAAADGRAAISPHALPLLATAGTGDVLAGAIAGLIAQGAEAFEAAACGVHVHALAALEAADELGDRGLLAHELLPQIPRAIRIVREGRRPPNVSTAPFGGLGELGGLGNFGGSAARPQFEP